MISPQCCNTSTYSHYYLHSTSPLGNLLQVVVVEIAASLLLLVDDGIYCLFVRRESFLAGVSHGDRCGGHHKDALLREATTIGKHMVARGLTKHACKVLVP